MEIGFSVNDAVRKRYSVRTYDVRPVEQAVRAQLLAYGECLQNPLGPKANFRFLEKDPAAGGEKLGTYGVIKGAGLYLGATIADEKTAPEALGYEFEQMVLYATSLGLGTCWLGGTFNRSAFADAMNVRPGELFPVVSPVGYPAAQKRVSERLFRSALRADQRQKWFYRAPEKRNGGAVCVPAGNAASCTIGGQSAAVAGGTGGKPVSLLRKAYPQGRNGRCNGYAANRCGHCHLPLPSCGNGAWITGTL